MAWMDDVGLAAIAAGACRDACVPSAEHRAHCASIDTAVAKVTDSTRGQGAFIADAILLRFTTRRNAS